VTDDHHAAPVVLLDGGGKALRPAGVAVGDTDAELLVAVELYVDGESG
jgi:hypothetical protein